jgi:peptide/nickel transport system permease protein
MTVQDHALGGQPSAPVETGAEVWRRYSLEHRGEQTLDESRPPLSARRRFLGRFTHQKPAMAALVFLVLLVVVAVFAPLLAPYDPDKQNLTNVFASPSSEHWLGTDQLGRDVFSRLLFGARVSLLAAVQAVAIGLALGLIPGLVAGFVGGWVDVVIMRIAEAVMTFPGLLLAIAFVAVLGQGLTKAMIAVGIVFAPRLARLVRGLVLSVREETFIEASRSIGTPTHRIIRQHVVPNVMSPLVVQISLALGFAMLAEAALSFLGLGVRPPQSSWGSMLQTAYQNISQSAWLAIPPGVAIMCTVLAFNLLGDGIRDSLGKEIRRER